MQAYFKKKFQAQKARHMAGPLGGVKYRYVYKDFSQVAEDDMWMAWILAQKLFAGQSYRLRR